MIQCLTGLPACYADLGDMAVNPVRSGRAVRSAPGSRVLASPEADALMRTMADTLGGWAARVRSVPQLSLVRHGHPHGSQGQVGADCGTLATHPDPLLALPPGPMCRTWTFPPARPGTRPPAPVPCRLCGLPVSPSPSGEYWWPAVCTHPAAIAVTVGEDEKKTITGWRCRVCAAPLPASWRPPRGPACRHQPSGAVPEPLGGIPAGVKEQIADLEWVRAGDGWVTALTSLHGGDAALEVIDLHAAAIRLLRQDPAPPDLLDGIPCRSCDAMSSLEIIPAPPPDPAKPPPPFCRCSRPGCRDEMTRREYDDWVLKYAAWTRGEGVLTCRRCELRNCTDCCFRACACRAAGHRMAA
jgi:hypothetical protein